MPINLEPDDYSMVVKNRANHAKPWRWLIYRAGRSSPVDQSSVYFETMTMARRAGKEAFRLFLANHYAQKTQSPANMPSRGKRPRDPAQKRSG
jgi:hypothetical protein